MLSISVYAFYNWGGSPKPEDFGYFGSYVGGVAGPLITALSVFFLIQQLKNDKEKTEVDRYMRMERDFNTILRQTFEIKIAHFAGIPVTVGNMLGLGGYPSNATQEDISLWVTSIKKLEGQLVHPIVSGLHCLHMMVDEYSNRAILRSLSISYSEAWKSYVKLIGEQKIDPELNEYIEAQIKLLAPQKQD